MAAAPLEEEAAAPLLLFESSVEVVSELCVFVEELGVELGVEIGVETGVELGEVLSEVASDTRGVELGEVLAELFSDDGVEEVAACGMLLSEAESLFAGILSKLYLL